MMKENDYFTVDDMKQHGPEIWESVRAKLREEGNIVINGYGMYSHSIDGRHYIFLSANGNLVHTKEKPKGSWISIREYISKPSASIKPIKVRTGSNKTKIRLAFQHLVGLGYSDRNRDAIVGRDGRMAGLFAAVDGVIYLVTTEKAFDEVYENVDELLFDIETTSVLTNARIKKKKVEVMGFKVDEDALIAFLKDQSAKSAASALFLP